MRRTSPSRLRIRGPDNSSQAPPSVTLLTSHILPSITTGAGISSTNADSEGEMRSLESVLIFSHFFFQVFAVLDTQAQGSGDRKLPGLMAFTNADKRIKPNLHRRGVPELIELEEPLKTAPETSINDGSHHQAAVQAEHQAKEGFKEDRVERWTDVESETPEIFTFSGSEADSSDLAQTPDVSTVEGGYFEQDKVSEVPIEEGRGQERKPMDRPRDYSRRLSIKDRIQQLMAAENSAQKRNVEAIPLDTWTSAKVAEIVNSFEGRSKAESSRADHVQESQPIPSREMVRHILDHFEENTKSPSQNIIGSVDPNRLEVIEEDVSAIDHGLREDQSPVKENPEQPEKSQGSTGQPEAITMKAPEVIPTVNDINTLESPQREQLAGTRGKYDNVMIPVTEERNEVDAQETQPVHRDTEKFAKFVDDADENKPLIKNSNPDGKYTWGDSEGGNKVSEQTIDLKTPISPQKASSSEVSSGFHLERMEAGMPNEKDAAKGLHHFLPQLDVEGTFPAQDEKSPRGLVGTAARNTDSEVLDSLTKKLEDTLKAKRDQRVEANKRRWQKVVEWLRAPMSIPLGRGKMKDAEQSKDNTVEEKMPKSERELIAGLQNLPAWDPQRSQNNMMAHLHDPKNNQNDYISESSDDKTDDMSIKEEDFAVGASGSSQGSDDQPPPRSILQKKILPFKGILKKDTKSKGRRRVWWRNPENSVRRVDAEPSVMTNSDAEPPHPEIPKESGYRQRSDINQEEHFSDKLRETNAQNNPARSLDANSELRGMKTSKNKDGSHYPLSHKNKSELSQSSFTRLEDQGTVDFIQKKLASVDKANPSQTPGNLRRSKSAALFHPSRPSPDQPQELKNNIFGKLWATSFKALSSILKAGEIINRKCIEYKESLAEKLMRLGPHGHSVSKYQNGDFKKALNEQDDATERPEKGNEILEDFNFDELRPFVHTRAHSFSNAFEFERGFSEHKPNLGMDYENEEYHMGSRHRLAEVISPHRMASRLDLSSNYIDSPTSESDVFNSFKNSLPNVNTKVFERSKSCISRTDGKSAKRKHLKSVSFQETDLDDDKGCERDCVSQNSSPKAQGNRKIRNRPEFTMSFTRRKDSEALLAKLSSLETERDSSSRAPQGSMPYYAKKASILRGHKPEKSHLIPLKGLQILKPKSENGVEHPIPKARKELPKLLQITDFMRRIQALSRHWIVPLLIPQPALKANLLFSFLPIPQWVLHSTSPVWNLNGQEKS